MKKIIAKFNSTCAETGIKIKKGDTMYYDYSTRKCYSLYCNKAKGAENIDSAAGMVSANEDAYFDNFCAYNNI